MFILLFWSYDPDKKVGGGQKDRQTYRQSDYFMPPLAA